MNLQLVEHHPQWVLEAFRRGEFEFKIARGELLFCVGARGPMRWVVESVASGDGDKAAQSPDQGVGTQLPVV